MESARQYHIVLVDDTISIHTYVSYMLDRHTQNLFTITSVISAEEMFKVLSSQHVDAVLLDIDLPGQSGLEVWDSVHRDYEETAVVFITASTDFSTLEQAGSVAPILRKPFSGQQLVQILQMILDINIESSQGRVAALKKAFANKREAISQAVMNEQNIESPE